MRLVSVPSLELLPVHLVALQVLVLVLAVARMGVDVHDHVRTMLPCVVADADAQGGQDSVDRLARGFGDGADESANGSRVGDRSCIDCGRGSQGGEGESSGELHVEVARGRRGGGVGKL